MKERTPSKGNEKKAISMSFLSLLMPWTMESTSKKWYKWLEFGIFHVGIALAIAASFIISFSPETITGDVSIAFRAVFAISLLIVIIRTGRRLFLPVNRLISHPDDYFSIIMMALWFFFGIFALQNDGTSKAYFDESNIFLLIYLGITAFLIAYVPFSKMSHYILWPFSRYYFGKTFGHRGTYPKVKGL